MFKFMLTRSMGIRVEILTGSALTKLKAITDKSMRSHLVLDRSIAVLSVDMLFTTNLSLDVVGVTITNVGHIMWYLHLPGGDGLAFREPGCRLAFIQYHLYIVVHLYISRHFFVQTFKNAKHVYCDRRGCHGTLHLMRFLAADR